MKIAHVTATFPPYLGGTGNSAFRQAEALTARGHKVVVLTSGGGRAVKADAPFEVIRLTAPVRLGNAPMTPGLIKALKGFDIVHLHCPYIFGSEFTALAASLHSSPLVVTHHNDLVASGWRGALFKAYSGSVARIAYSAADRIVATSSDYARHCRITRLRDEDVVRVVPNGVDVGQFCPPYACLPHGRGEDGLVPAEPYVLFVGAMDRAHSFKGIPVLLDAVAELHNVHVVLAGDGELRSSYEVLAERRVPGRARFVGRTPGDKLVRLYQDAAVTVLPSTTAGEAFGMVLLESLACGTPVVASHLPGVRSVVADGIDGVLVPPGDPSALAFAIRTVVDDPVRGRRMGMAGRSKVVASYTWERVGGLLEDLYLDVLAHRVRPEDNPVSSAISKAHG